MNKISIIKKKTFLGNSLLSAILFYAFASVFGVTSFLMYTGIKLLFFMSSLVFALGGIYLRDPDVHVEKVKQGLMVNKQIGLTLFFLYVILYGFTGVSVLSGVQLMFFTFSFFIAVSFMYLRSPECVLKIEIKDGCVNRKINKDELNRISYVFNKSYKANSSKFAMDRRVPAA